MAPASRHPSILAWVRRVCAALVATFFIGTTGTASAAWWVEVAVTRDDVRVQIAPSGEAEVQHRIRLDVAGGPLYRFEIRGVDPDAVLVADAYAVPASEAAKNSLASAVPVAAELRKGEPTEDGAPEPYIELKIDEGNGIPRGAWLLQIRYRTHLAKRGLITPDGALTRVEWTGARWEDGLDATRATFVLPSAPTPPRAEDPSTEDPDDAAEIPPTFLSSLRRTSEHDELELLRPYAPRGERVTWKLQVDRRALAVGGGSPAPAPDDARGAVPPSGTGRGLAVVGETRGEILLGAFGALFALYGLLVALKMVSTQRLARASGAASRPLLPMPVWARAPLAGAALVGGVALQLSLKEGTSGSALVALAALLAAHRSPRWDPRPLRGPGRWLVASPREAFGPLVPPRGGYLDASTRRGKVTLAISILLIGAAVASLARISSYYATLAALDAVAIVALFVTGVRSQLPPDPAVAPAQLLRGVSRRLTRKLGDAVKVAPRIRVPDGSPDPDELRLLVVPKRPLEGLYGIEVGVVFAPGLARALALPELLVRGRAGSPCEPALRALTSRGRVVRGRRPDEIVVALSPRWPGIDTTAALVVALVTRLTAPAVRGDPRTRSASSAKPEAARKAA